MKNKGKTPANSQELRDFMQLRGPFNIRRICSNKHFEALPYIAMTKCRICAQQLSVLQQ